MAEIVKWNSTQVLPIIRHNMRRLDGGNKQGNASIRSELTHKNYSFVERGNTCKEINNYRKLIEKQCYRFNRKNLIHAVEIVIQCPTDCPDEQRDSFFEVCFEYICNMLPMGEKCIFVAEVHLDEKHLSPNKELLSKGHIHIMYVPAVPDVKHDEYEFKLCADALTRKAILKAFHPELQQYLSDKGIQATVYHPKSGRGKNIGLSVQQLKEITQRTGIRIDNTITTERFSEILKENVENRDKILQQECRIRELENTILVRNNCQDKNTSWGQNAAWGTLKSWGTVYQMEREDIEYDK